MGKPNPYDNEFYQNLNAQLENLLTDRARISFLTDISFLSENDSLPESARLAVDEAVSRFMIPLKEDGTLDQELFEKRQKEIASYKEEAYRATGSITASVENNKTLAPVEKVEKLARETLEDPLAQNIYKISSLYSFVFELENVSPDRYNALSNAYDFKNVGISRFLRFLPEKNIGKGQDLEDNRIVELGKSDNLMNPDFDPASFAVSEEEKNAIRKELQALRKDTIPDTLAENLIIRDNIFGFVKNPEKQKQLFDIHRNREFADVLKHCYFESEMQKDRNKTKLSFGRKGSDEFQQMDHCIIEVQNIVKEAGELEGISDEKKADLVRALKHTVEAAAVYTDKKLENGRDVSQIRNKHTKARVEYALKSSQKAKELLEALTGAEVKKSKKSGTFIEGVKGVGEPVLKDKKGNVLSERAGSYDGLSVPADFKDAVQKSELKDRVGFTKLPDGGFLMTPKYPEKGTDKGGNDFSIRKNINYIMKAAAQSYFRDPAAPALDNLDLSQGMEKSRNLMKALLAYQDASRTFGEVQNKKNKSELKRSKEKLMSVCRIPAKEQADFFRFLDAAAEKDIELGDLVDYMSDCADRARSVYRCLNSKNALQKDKQYAENNLVDYMQAVNQLRETALINPEKEQKMLILNECQVGEKIMSDMEALADGRPLTEKSQIVIHYEDCEKALLDADRNYEKAIAVTSAEPDPELKGKPNPLTPAETARAMVFATIADPAKNDIAQIREYYSSLSILPETEKADMMSLVEKNETDPDKHSMQTLNEKYFEHIKQHMQFIASNKETVMAGITEDIGKKGINEQNTADFNYHVVHAAGTVNYKGENCLITFDTTAPPTGQLLNGIGMHDVKIGIFRNENEAVRLYSDTDNYHDKALEKAKTEFVSKKFDPEPKNAKVLPEEYKIFYEKQKNHVKESDTDRDKSTLTSYRELVQKKQAAEVNNSVSKNDVLNRKEEEKDFVSRKKRKP